jgi:ATP-dependent RNA circularization protein (DNA/RNA ligase family)
MDQFVLISEKVEGSNWYGGVDPTGSYFVGQRSGAIIPEDYNNPSHTWWKTAVDQKLLYAAYRIQADYAHGKSITIRGEIAGGNIQGNIYKMPRIEIFAFDIMIDGKYVDADKFLSLTSSYDIQIAPVIASNVRLRDWLGGKTIKEAANGKSLMYDTLREGIVIKPMKEQYSGVLGGRLMIKQRDPIYLAKTDN